MSQRFKRALPHILRHEGGFVNHPRDPGGATNMGVTQRTYDTFRDRRGQPRRSVRGVSDAEVEMVYRQQYWSPIRADDLPSGVAYCVFDAAVNSGPGRAVRWLQQVIGAKVDGIVGNETLSLAAKMKPQTVINKFCDKRLAFVRRLSHYDAFGRGWERRISEVRDQSLAWAENRKIPEGKAEAPGKADGEARVTEVIKDAVKDPASLAPFAGLFGSAATLVSGSGPVQWAIAAALVMGAAAGIWWLVRGRHADMA